MASQYQGLLSSCSLFDKPLDSLLTEADLPAQVDNEREPARPPIEPVPGDTDSLRGLVNTEEPILLIPVSIALALRVEPATREGRL